MKKPISALPPTPADCVLLQACADARARLRAAITATWQGDGDFWFVSERRLHGIARELADMEQLFVDLYGPQAIAQCGGPKNATTP